MKHTPKLVAAAVALGAVLVGSAASARLTDPPPPTVEQTLADEIDAMRAAGMPDDHPKVETLQDDLDAMRSSDATAPSEPGIDLGALVDDARAHVEAEEARQRRSTARVDAADAAGWDNGEVTCEPVPGLLTVEDIAGATCGSVPQPDGTARYVALGRDRVVRTVRFGHDGDVERLPDRRAPAEIHPSQARVAPTPGGDIEITPRGKPPVIAELP